MFSLTIKLTPIKVKLEKNAINKDNTHFQPFRLIKNRPTKDFHSDMTSART